MDQCGTILASKRAIHYMAKKEYFDGKFAWFFKMMGCISVNRSIHDDEAKKKAMDVLKDGKALGIFPEGTRNKTDAFYRIQKEYNNPIYSCYAALLSHLPTLVPSFKTKYGYSIRSNLLTLIVIGDVVSEHCRII